VLVASHAHAADCTGPRLTLTQSVICADQELSQADDRLARRVRSIQKRLGFGFYLGVRYWQHRGAEEREACESSRACILSTYRTQNRTLDRLIGCLENSVRKRTCLRVTLSNEAATSQR
jgi:uncharacterized protein